MLSCFPSSILLLLWSFHFSYNLLYVISHSHIHSHHCRLVFLDASFQDDVLFDYAIIVLDRYFNDIAVLRVESEEEGWNRIKDKPSPEPFFTHRCLCLKVCFNGLE